MIIDSSGNYAIYSTKGEGVGGSGIGASVGKVYYNAPDIDTVLYGDNSATHGGMLAVVGFYNTLFEKDGVSYSGLSIPIGVGLGISRVWTSSKTIKRGNIFDD